MNWHWSSSDLCTTDFRFYERCPRLRGSATRVLLCKSKILFAPDGHGKRQLAVKFAPAAGSGIAKLHLTVRIYDTTGQGRE